MKIKAHEQLTVRITGVAPLILHNGHLADPLNDYARAIKKISGKRKKTDDDHLEMHRLEWYGSLYLGSDGNGGERVIMPGECLEATLVSGAKKVRMGPAFKAGVIINDTPLTHDGPSDIDKLWEDKQYRLVRNVRVKTATVVRCRPFFTKWSLEFDIHYLPSLLNREQVFDVLKTAGQIVGLCDWRPKYGRFTVEDLSDTRKK